MPTYGQLFNSKPLLFMHSADQVAIKNALLIIEEGKWVTLDNRWTARADNPHVTGMKPHNHLYLKGNEVFVVNRDGTPSHGSDLSKMPTYVKDMLRSRNLLEGHYKETAYTLDTSQYIPTEFIDKVHDYIERQNRMMRLLSNIGYGGQI